MTKNFRAPIAVALGALALSATALPAHAADCFYGENGQRPCVVSRDADGSFTMNSDEFGEDVFVALAAGEGGDFERVSWDQERGRPYSLGYYNNVADTPGCVQNTQFETDIICAWD